MRKSPNNNGFSLTEVLLAVGTLGIGMLFIAGVFPVAIHFATIATEQTIAVIVADEAFAKVRLYAIGDPNTGTGGIDFNKLTIDRLTDFSNAANIDPNEFAYPSTDTPIIEKQYYWSALCRLTEPYSGPADPRRLVQVTVFVCRKVGSGTRYWYRDPLALPLLTTVPNPVPVWLNVSQPVGFNPDSLLISDVIPADGVSEITFINDGYTIVENTTGRIYRVLERDADAPDIILLDRPWQGGSSVWVVPPPQGGGRYPCIAVYQKVIRF